MALAAVCFWAALLGVERQDDGWLLLAAGQPVDAAGRLSSLWTRTVRDCHAVMQPSPGQLQHERAVQALRDYSPPDSASARVLAVQALGPWRLVQATFDTLEPVVVVVRDDGMSAEVVPQAVWSGSTRPWDAGWRIRDFIGSRAGDVPLALINCLDPAAVFEGLGRNGP